MTDDLLTLAYEVAVDADYHQDAQTLACAVIDLIAKLDAATCPCYCCAKHGCDGACRCSTSTEQV